MKKNFFTDFISHINDISFTPDGLVVTRDCLTVKVWSPAQPDRPLERYNVYNPVISKLDHIVDNDIIYDRFSLSVNSTGNLLMSGSFDRSFHIFNRATKKNTRFRADFEPKTKS